MLTSSSLAIFSYHVGIVFVGKIAAGHPSIQEFLLKIVMILFIHFISFWRVDDALDSRSSMSPDSWYKHASLWIILVRTTFWYPSKSFFSSYEHPFVLCCWLPFFWGAKGMLPGRRVPWPPGQHDLAGSSQPAPVRGPLVLRKPNGTRNTVR